MPSMGLLLKMVFSTYVEVIPGFEGEESILESILHVCGGDPGVLAVAS